MLFNVTVRDIARKERVIQVDAADLSSVSSKVIPLLRPGEAVDTAAPVSSRFGSLSSRRTLPINDISDFCLDLSELLASGVNAHNALEQIRGTKLRKSTKAMLDRMVSRSAQGANLAANFTEERAFLGDITVTLAVHGAETGKMDESLRMVVKILDRQAKRRDALVSALAMPCLALLVLAFILIGALFFFIPQVKDQMASRTTPNIATLTLFAASDYAREYWWVLLTALVGAIVFFSRPSRARRAFTRFINQISIVQKSFGTASNADFALLLGSLIVQKVPNLEALKITARRFSGSLLGAQLDSCIGKMKEGADIAKMLEQHTSLDPRTVTAINVGNATRHLGPHLIDFAERMYLRSDRAFGSFQRAISISAIFVVSFFVVLVYACIQGPVLELWSTYTNQ